MTMGPDEPYDALPARLGRGTLTPEAFAALFAPSLAAPAARAARTERIQRRLFELTVRIARARSAVLREHLADVDPEAVTQEGPAAVPLMTRRHLESDQRALCLDDLTLASVTFTRAVQGERPATIYVSREERHFATAVIQHMARAAAARPQLPLLLLRTNPQGDVRGLMFHEPTLFAPFEAAHDFGLVHRLLLEPFLVGAQQMRITSVHGRTGDILALTGKLQEVGQAPEALDPVAEVSFSGRLLSRREARFLRSYWRHAVVDRFVTSELPTSNPSCDSCEGHHFHPMTLHEVVDPTSGRTIASGRGLLVVTGLHPLHQMTPLIRYPTGDVVDVHRSDCPRGPVVFRPLGRLARSVSVPIAGQPAYLLTPKEVLDVLDELPEVRRGADGRRGERGEAWGAVPSFELQPGSPPRVAVEVRLEPEHLAGAAAKLRARITEGLRARCPALERPLAEGGLTIELFGPARLARDGSPSKAAQRRRALAHDPVGIAAPPGLLG